MYFYRYRNNLIYDFNPLVTSLFTLTAVFLALLFSNPLYLFSLFTAVVLVIIASENKEVLKSYLYYSFFLCFLIILINLIFSPGGDTVLLSFAWGEKVFLFTGEALIYGVSMSIRLLTIIGSFFLFSCVVNPDWLFDFTGFLGEKTAVLFNLALRLFPLILYDFRRIGEVQALRGLDYRQGGLREKVKNSGVILEAVLFSGLERSREMAQAMYVKGYGEGKRTYYYHYLWRVRDYAVLIILLAGFSVSILCFYKGWGEYSFYPELMALKTGDYVLSLFIFMVFSLPAVLKWSEQKWKKLR